MSIEVSDAFSSFTEFEEKLLEFKERNFTEVYIWDCVTIQKAKKRGVKIPFKDIPSSMHVLEAERRSKDEAFCWYTLTFILQFPKTLFLNGFLDPLF